MDEGWSRWQRTAIVAVSVVAAAGLWLTGDRSAGNLVFVVLSVAAAAAVAWLTPSRPAAAFGVLFLVASLSRGTISTPVGNMRFEQPAIVAGFAALVLARQRIDLGRLRPLWPIGAAFGLYLACLTLSSVLFAPDRADSLRMTFWTGLSMAGGVLALLLLARSNARVTDWILLSGYVQAIPAFVIAILFFSLGPVLIAGATPAPGVQEPLSSLPKVFSLSWEANIYASFLAALTPIGINRLLSGNRLADRVLVPVMVAAIALGVTRGAYLGLMAGLAVYVLLAVAPARLRDRQTLRRVGVWGAVIAGSFGAGLLLTAVLLAGGRQPTNPLDFTKSNWGRGPAATAPGPIKVLSPPDTITFRLDRVPVALADMPNSLIVGLGANSFGQRHADPSSKGAPDHISILVVAALYESGVLGAAGLGIGFLLVLLALFKATRTRADRGTIAAYAGAIACLLVAYEATNALNFALIWLLVGAGLAAAIESAGPAPGEEPSPAGEPAPAG
jgi:hypothetical protein